MTDPTEPSPAPNLTDRAEAGRQKRLAREAAALRENLRRRKAQSRARQDAAPVTPGTADEPG